MVLYKSILPQYVENCPRASRCSLAGLLVVHEEFNKVRGESHRGYRPWCEAAHAACAPRSDSINASTCAIVSGGSLTVWPVMRGCSYNS